MKISVITATWNSADTIAETLKSVRSQTYKEVEHVIQDGESTDGTAEIVRRAMDENAILICERDEGLYDALNKGLARASGEVIGFMHSDDFYATERALEQVATAFQDPDVDGVYGDLDYVSAEDPHQTVRAWVSGPYKEANLKLGWMPPHPTLYLRRSVYERFGRFDTGFDIAADYEAMLRYLVQGRIRLVYLPVVLVKMRLGGVSNRSLKQVLKKSREDLTALRRHGVGDIQTLFMKNIRKLGQFLPR